MPRHRPRNRRPARRPRRNGLAPFSSNLFNDNTRGTLTVPTGLSTQVFEYKDICPSLTSKRLISLRRISVMFPPTSEITPGATVDVQFQLYDQVSNELITMNKGIILSNTNPRRMSMNIPANYARYHRNDSGIFAFAILINNTNAAATWTVLTNVHYHVAFEPNITFAPRHINSISTDTKFHNTLPWFNRYNAEPESSDSISESGAVNVTLEMLRKLAVTK